MCGQGARAESRAPTCDRPPNAEAQLGPAPQAAARSAPDQGIGKPGSGRRPWSAVAPRGFVRPPAPGHRPDPAKTPKLAPQGSLMSTRFQTERGWGCIRTQDTDPSCLSHELEEREGGLLPARRPLGLCLAERVSTSGKTSLEWCLSSPQVVIRTGVNSLARKRRFCVS